MPIGCEEVAFEDLSDLETAALIKRWKFSNFQKFNSRGLGWDSFGSSIRSPSYNLGAKTHVDLDIGFAVIDVPQSDDCGMVVWKKNEKKLTQHHAGCHFN